MKKTFLLCCIILFAAMANAQYVTITNDYSKMFLENKYPSCFNGVNMMDTTCAEIVNEDSLILIGQHDLNWLKYFKNLKYLTCKSLPLVSWPSLPSSLTYLECSNNYQLGSLPVLPSSLQHLVCNTNYKITTLPELPSSLQHLVCTDNYELSTLPVLPSSLQYLDCSKNPKLGTLPLLPPSIQYLDCSKNNLTVLPVLPSSLQHLDCSNTYQLKALPVLPSSLQHLNCSGNYQLTALPELPSSLQYLDCSNNSGITALPVLPNTLQHLDCGADAIGSLPLLPTSLLHLDCNTNQISILPDLPPGIQYVNCYHNQIMVLPALPPSLQNLHCAGNLLSNLPSLPASIIELACYSNKITTLPPLPASLTSLDCGYNSLNKLPDLPSTLTFLSCQSNHLTALPALPLFLKSLLCGLNPMTSLPSLPNSLNMLRCENGQLTSLPALPDSITTLSIQGNNIYCMPVFQPKNIYSLSIILDAAKIRCLPYIFPFANVRDGASNSTVKLPSCNPTNNSHGCYGLPFIKGSIFYDHNKNGIKDNNEVYGSGTRVVSTNGAYSFANNDGYYEIGADTTGPVSLSIADPLFSISNPGSANFNFNSYDTSVVQNFAVQPAIIKDSLSVTIVPVNARVRPGSACSYNITCQNVGTSFLSSVDIQLQFDEGSLNYYLSSNPAVSRAGNILTLNVASLPYGARENFTAGFYVKTIAPIGDTICARASASAKTTVAHNDACNVITGSYDPNDKQSTPSLSPKQVNDGEYVYYTIRFQNTGNDTAFTVVIADTLTNKLQKNSLQILSSSHLCKATVKDGIAYFEFLNIQLPDSNVNELASHGFVQFRVKPQSNLTLNTQVENKSYIYFDYNKPVLTNTAITIIKDLPLPISLLSFTGWLQGNQTNLYWQTASEINFSRFEVERSADAVRFKKIGDKLSNANILGSAYSLTDAQPLQGRNYYRLKIIDKDGSSTYSAVVLVILNKDKFSVLISPNPGMGKFSIQLFNWNNQNGSVRIADMNGRIVYKKESIGRNVSTLPIDIQGLAKGMYMVTIEGEGKKLVQKLVIQ